MTTDGGNYKCGMVGTGRHVCIARLSRPAWVVWQHRRGRLSRLRHPGVPAPPLLLLGRRPFSLLSTTPTLLRPSVTIRHGLSRPRRDPRLVGDQAPTPGALLRRRCDHPPPASSQRDASPTDGGPTARFGVSGSPAAVGIICGGRRRWRRRCWGGAPRRLSRGRPSRGGGRCGCRRRFRGGHVWRCGRKCLWWG